MQVRRLTLIVATVGLLVAACGSDTAAEGPSVTVAPSVAPSSSPPAPDSSTAPTTVPQAPPELSVTDPRPGAVVTTRAYRFEGTVEPGSELIAAGQHEVPVAADGTWSIVLMLDPGSNPARFVATNQGGPSCVELSVRYEPPIDLLGNGLGVVDFGHPADEALDILEATLGPPSSGEDGFYRYSSWDAVGLTVAFDDGPFYRDDGVEHLVAWSVSGDPRVPLNTSADISIGAPLDELLSAHAERVGEPISNDECMPPWYVWLNDPGTEAAERILVAFDDAPHQGGVINYLHAGASEGC